MKLKYRHYCNEYENIENYEKAKADNFEGWHIHHRLETHNSDGERRPVDISRKELIKLGMYYNRPAEELIFLTVNEHKSIHKNRLGKYFSEEAKKKISDANKRRQLSEETKNKISENSKGRRWYNNGTINKFCYECPIGFIPGRLPCKK